MSSKKSLVSHQQAMTEETLKDLKILTVGGFKNLTGDVDIVKSRRKAKYFFEGKPPLVDINDVFPNTDFTPLMCACWVGNKKIVNILLNNGAQPIGNDKSLVSAFHIVVTKNNFELLELLIEKFPQYINHQDKKGMSPLMYAAELKNPEMMKILIEYNADINLVNNFGKTAYDIAKENINDTSFKWLNYHLLKEKVETVKKEEKIRTKAKI